MNSKISYKTFVKTSKWLMRYNEKTKLQKLLFNLVLPLKYLKFKIVIGKEDNNEHY